MSVEVPVNGSVLLGLYQRSSLNLTIDFFCCFTKMSFEIFLLIFSFIYSSEDKITTLEAISLI